MSVPDFAALFGREPAATASAPGRVNLLGEHTDYNDGLVLPLAIPQVTTVELAPSPDGLHRFHSVELGKSVEFTDGEPPPEGFARYVHGCIAELRAAGHAVPALSARIHSDVPIGAGLSSSAALEVAVLRALRELLELDVDDVAIARLAHRAEVLHAGVRCGILDQMASSLAGPDRLLYLDTRSLERRLVPLPAGARVLIIDSGLSRELSGSGYNTRRAECEEAARLLGVGSLRDAPGLAEIAKLPPPLDRRARHVWTENERVHAAVAGVDAAAFGALMSASHASLRDDYEVSVPGLDALAAALDAEPDVFGAKLTGAGFGGACVALVKEGEGRRIARDVQSALASRLPLSRLLMA